MMDSCEGLRGRLSAESRNGSESALDPGLLVHLRSCPACREQWRMHRALVQLRSEVDPPEPSEDFASRLRARVGEPRRVPRSWTRAVLAVYWLAASAVAAAILVRLPWAHIEPGWLAVQGVAAAVLCSGWLVGPRPLRWLDRLASALAAPPEQASG